MNDAGDYLDTLPEVRIVVSHNAMVYLNSRDGASFRCVKCGCNVFTQYTDDMYECHGCQTEYQGERA